MSQPTSAELALLRTQPHRSQYHLSIYKPAVVISAQVNDASIAKGDRVIAYDNVTVDYGVPFYHGLTFKIGTSPGSDDVGIGYVRDVTDRVPNTSGNIVIGENSHINWVDDLYVTITNFPQIFPLYPRYISDGEDITIYKDYDIAYTDQNEVLGAFICMGSHYASFLDKDTGETSIYWTATGTSHMIDGVGLSYHWLFPTGNPTFYDGMTPGNVVYDDVGHHGTYLTVSGTNGSVDTAIRNFSIYDRPGEGDFTPTLSWGFDSDLSGDRNAGGYSVNLWVKEDVEDVDDGALVVIWADDWYGTTKQSIGGNQANREDIVFVGYIDGSTIEFDYKDSQVRFTVVSPIELMKKIEAFSVSVEDSTDPISDAESKGVDPWFYLVGLTTKTALYHYIRWHSTINVCNDVEYNAEDFNIQFFDADRASLYDAINNFMNSTLLGKAINDRAGKLWFEIEYEAINNSADNIPLNMFVDNHDWMGEPSIQERLVKDVSYLELGGVSWDGASANTFSALLSSAPGEVPFYRGNPETLSGLALTDQDQLNTLSGNVYANRNARYPEVTINLNGNYRNFDIAPQELARLTWEGKTFRQLDWVQKPFAIRRVDYSLNQEKQIGSPTLTLAEVVQGFAGDTIDIPEIPPDPGYGQNPIETPTIPPIYIPGIGISGGVSNKFVPAIGARNVTDLVDIVPTANSGGYGYLFPDSKTCYMQAKIVVPDTATVFSFYPVFAGIANSGNIYGSNSATQNDYESNTINDPSTGLIAVPFDSDPFLNFGSPGFVVSGNITYPVISLTFYRYAANAADTYNRYIHCFGFVVAFA